MQIDQFESQFKSAAKEPYEYQEQALSRLCLVGGKDQNTACKLQNIATRLLSDTDKAATFTLLPEDTFDSMRDLLSKIEEAKPDLIIAERNIKVPEENLVYGLNSYVETLTQLTQAPVLLLPNLSLEEMETSIRDSSDVMVETNHLTGDSRLINWGVVFTKPSGALFLYHIEDDLTFSRYVDVISKIPEINTELAEEKIKEELLKLPSDFIQKVKDTLAEKFPQLAVEGLVKLGHSLLDYRELLERHQIDLLIINSKDEDHLAMEGIAYEIAVEFKHKPILLL